MIKLDKDIFIEKARQVHGDKYDYSKVEYVNNKTKICIICPEHGEFYQTPNAHLNGQGCKNCGSIHINDWHKKTFDDFVKLSNDKFNNKFLYDKNTFIDFKTKMKITCPEHGEFYQSPYNHLKSKNGCPKCGDINRRKNTTKNTEWFIEKARQVHGDKYDYSKTEYKGTFENVIITCKKHGDFLMKPNNHLNGNGCKICSNEKLHDERAKTNEKFIEDSKKIHGYKYNYSKVSYINSHNKVCIICPEHGEFWQTPNDHLSGKGCPICNNSKLENEIKMLLEVNNIKYVCRANKRNIEWIGNQHLDFYLPEYGIAIECQGEQHFYPVDFGNKGRSYAKEKLLYVKKLDRLKKEKCLNNGIKLIYYSNKKYNNSIISNKDEILKVINNAKF